MKIAFIEPSSGTDRSCSECQDPALYFGFTANVKGGINKSSRTPLCIAHAVISE